MADESWSDVELRGRVNVSSIRSESGTQQILVVLLNGTADGTVADVVGEYVHDLAARMTDGWTLLTTAMYPLGHRAGAGYPGMDLDKAMVLATYRRDEAAKA
jgi:hypothetical protein